MQNEFIYKCNNVSYKIAIPKSCVHGTTLFTTFSFYYIIVKMLFLLQQRLFWKGRHKKQEDALFGGWCCTCTICFVEQPLPCFLVIYKYNLVVVVVNTAGCSSKDNFYCNSGDISKATRQKQQKFFMLRKRERERDFQGFSHMNTLCYINIIALDNNNVCRNTSRNT